MALGETQLELKHRRGEPARRSPQEMEAAARSPVAMSRGVMEPEVPAPAGTRFRPLSVPATGQTRPSGRRRRE